jgi:hypothetical protein
MRCPFACSLCSHANELRPPPKLTFFSHPNHHFSKMEGKLCHFSIRECAYAYSLCWVCYKLVLLQSLASFLHKMLRGLAHSLIPKTYTEVGI